MEIMVTEVPTVSGKEDIQIVLILMWGIRGFLGWELSPFSKPSIGVGILMFGLVRVFGINGFILLTFTLEQMSKFMLMEHRYADWFKDDIDTGNRFALQFGRWTDETRNDRTFKGLMDDFRVYDDVLSASDILQVYGNGNGDLPGYPNH